MDEYQGLTVVDWREAFNYLLHEQFFWLVELIDGKYIVNRKIQDDLNHLGSFQKYFQILQSSLLPEYKGKIPYSIPFHHNDNFCAAFPCKYNSKIDKIIRHCFYTAQLEEQFGEVIERNKDKLFLKFLYDGKHHRESINNFSSLVDWYNIDPYLLEKLEIGDTIFEEWKGKVFDITQRIKLLSE
jgi:hypothetical protein